MEFVHSPHVVEKVPAARESIIFLGTITVLEEAQMRLRSMAMHSVGFPLMTEEASGRRKLNLGASIRFAAIRFEMGIQVFTVESSMVSQVSGMGTSN